MRFHEGTQRRPACAYRRYDRLRFYEHGRLRLTDRRYRRTRTRRTRVAAVTAITARRVSWIRLKSTKRSE